MERNGNPCNVIFAKQFALGWIRSILLFKPTIFFFFPPLLRYYLERLAGVRSLEIIFRANEFEDDFKYSVVALPRNRKIFQSVSTSNGQETKAQFFLHIHKDYNYTLRM